MKRWVPIAAVAAVMIATPLLARAIGAPFLVGVVTRLVIYALAAASLDLAMGYGGLVSFGHAAFFAVGGYVVAVLASLSPATGAPLLWTAAILGTALVGAAVGALALRTAGVQFIMITLAFGELIHIVLSSLEPFGGDDGLLLDRRGAWPGLGVPSDLTFYYVCLALFAVWLGVLGRLIDSPFGMVLRGARVSERRIASLGFTPGRYRLAAFTVSAAGMGLAGAMWADYAKFVSPDMADWSRSGEFMAMVILGGVGTLVGPAMGAAAYLAVEQFLSAVTERWLLVFGLGLVIVVTLRGRGLYGLLRRA